MGAQEDVQLVVMREIRDRGLVELDGVRRLNPQVDERDLVRALHTLLAEELIERASLLSSAPLERIAASKDGVHITDAGFAWLAAAE